MGILKKKPKSPAETAPESPVVEPPKFVRRSLNRASSFKSGRTIAERREKLETANERNAARKKVKQKQALRIVGTVLGFLIVIVIAVFAIKFFVGESREISNFTPTVNVPYAPTIEVVDEESGATGGHITSRMKEYIGQAEADFRELGYTPTRAVIPSGAIREVDFYLDGYNGFIKLIIDRGSGVSVEDADRMIRYLAGQGITDFAYIDVRTDGKAFWK